MCEADDEIESEYDNSEEDSNDESESDSDSDDDFGSNGKKRRKQHRVGKSKKKVHLDGVRLQNNAVNPDGTKKCHARICVPTRQC